MKKMFLLFLLSLSSVCLYAEKGYSYLGFAGNEIKVSSYLVEGDIIYWQYNLDPAEKLPWVPTGSNNGKDEYIQLKCNDTNEIYISIGYVDSENKSLYYKNSRPKKINVHFISTGEDKVYELKDTPEPQRIVLSDKEGGAGDIKITFLEVYEGTKFKDLCINFIAKKRFVEELSIYDDIKKINSNLQKKQCYVRILSLAHDSYRPKNTFRGCPGESFALFKKKQCENFVFYLGDGIGVTKTLYEKYIFPEFRKYGYEIENIKYEECPYEDAGVKDGTFWVTFSINGVSYYMSPWVYTEDYLIVPLVYKR
ncbi:NADase-type glycan-binding domain-containing protein [Treponema sp.]|uniref:NADase-type glycan-binding domain-containing protein n=1 Tax=Treponema sp. TaxID=166 RepID=UPI00298D9FF4|nr:hypothetical protein [Treponema sp.]MCR5613821.1 hypothetical protein [Treponema sp.]